MKITFSHPKQREILQGSFFKKDFLLEYHNKFLSTISDPRYGFFYLENRELYLQRSRELYKRFSDRKIFIHIGMGGSSLGSQMLYSSLGEHSSRRFIFINNIDPDHIHEQLKDLKIKNTIFYFVSKSGETPETMAVLTILTQYLLDQKVLLSELKNYFIFATDSLSSQLHDLGVELSISLLEIPENIGGRFSVLTVVGFLPALFADIDLDGLLKGAFECSRELIKERNILLQTASFLVCLKENFAIDQTVLMPYSTKLKDFSLWFVQLWAESLGKKYSFSKKETVFEGFTPIAACGSTDQHSQMQLFMEGPFDKCLIFLEIDKFDHDYSLDNSFDLPIFKSLDGHKLSELMRAELKGALRACEENSRPYIHILIERRTPYEMGRLILFFESLTVLTSHYLDVDAFVQPGVELSKKYALQWQK